MAIQDDFQVLANGNIRYTGTTANYTVIALHRWLGDLMDDAQASGNDILDITDATASERSTDNIITLKSPFNIDDVAAQHLYDGSVIQTNGDEIYDGILVFANAGAYLQIQQNGKIVAPNFWTTGLNADAANGISHRFILKVRTAAADIDGRRLVGQTREFGSTYSEFKINGTSRGNNVLALTYADDLNDETAAATVKGWTTITNTEGYRLIDVNDDTVDEPYYSEWNKATFTINQLYERLKWLSRRSSLEDSNAETLTDYAVGNATITGQAQSFSNGVVAQYLTRVHARLKKVGSPTGNLVAKIYTHSGVFGTSSVPLASQATSDNLDVAKLTTSYQELEIGFSTQFEMLASTNYVIAFEYSGGDASNYVHIEGDSTGTHAGNKSQNAAGWTAQAAEDLWFQCYASPKLYKMAGERFRGVTHQITVDTPTGTFLAVDRVTWSGGTGQMVAINSPTAPTKMWIQLLTGVAPTDGQTITGDGGGTADVNVTVTERTLSFPFCGQSTGSAIIGAYGLGIEFADLSASDKLTDLDATLRLPPNNVTFTVNGLVSGEDRVLVGPESGGTFFLGERTLATALTGVGETAVVVNSAIPSDTPSPSGTIRIELNSGIYRRVAYTSFAGSTYTIDPTDFSSDNASIGNDVMRSFIDKLATATSESVTWVYSANRSLFIRVRDGGVGVGDTPIKTFETTGTMGAAGGSSTAIRTSDT